MADKVSIVIPCYNQAEFLSQAIESALSQTYENFEVIVVNDGSTDVSLEVAKRYEGSIRILSQQNSGLVAARNAGIEFSKTQPYEFILPLDADDWIEPDYLVKTVPYMRGHRVAIVATYAAVFGIKDYTWYTFVPTIEQLMKDNSLPVCSLIKRSVLDEVGCYNNKMNSGYEDWNLWLDILKRGYKAIVVPEPLFHYREKKSSMLVEASKRREELVARIRSLHPDLYDPNRSMLGKWSGHRDATSGNREGCYGVPETYAKAAEFLKDGPVEDWGCGRCYARKFFSKGYKGVDGTADGCDLVADLATYSTQVPGILLRHVLEHNFEWEAVLKNALRSCGRLAVVVCTPFEETTRLLGVDEFGIPIFSFRKEDLTRHFKKYAEEVVDGQAWGSQVNETIFYVETR